MIDLKIDDFREGKVTFHISHQDEEDYKRLRDVPFPLKFPDGKKYLLCSGYFPDYHKEDKYFFVRGWNRTKDNRKIIVPFTVFLKIFELLQSYNKTS